MSGSFNPCGLLQPLWLFQLLYFIDAFQSLNCTPGEEENKFVFQSGFVQERTVFDFATEG